MADLTPQIVTGLFALGGAGTGAVLGGLVSRAGDKRRIKAEDDRRWLTDRRGVYAGYIALAGAMLQEIDSFDLLDR